MQVSENRKKCHAIAHKLGKEIRSRNHHGGLNPQWEYRHETEETIRYRQLASAVIERALADVILLGGRRETLGFGDMKVRRSDLIQFFTTRQEGGLHFWSSFFTCPEYIRERVLSIVRKLDLFNAKYTLDK